MGGKVTAVALQNDTLGVTEEFEIGHATRILRMQNNGGWHLPKSSKFEFNGNDIEYRTDTRGVEVPKEQGDNKQGDSATE